MLISIKNVLAKDEVKQFRDFFEKTEWQPGIKTAGTLSRLVKNNLQLDATSELSIKLRNLILRKLGNNSLFISAALPGKIYPPQFNCYANGDTYGNHIDSALMYAPETNTTVRTDISATLFLSEPNEYEGGELEIYSAEGLHSIKLNAGDMILYSANHLHQVNPVISGLRFASFFWIESQVRDETKRTILFELDQVIQGITATADPTDKNFLRLTGVYHNLLRMWAIT